MKNFLTLALVLGTILLTNAQTNAVDYSRKVSTKGYAEKEVTPDIIYLSISLKEYFLDGNTKKKITIEDLEKQLYNAAISNGVKKEDFTIQNIYSYNYETKKKSQELLQARQYRIKITDLSKLNTLFDNVDAKGMESTSISGYDHSQKKQIEKELKTEAVKDARINADILATADGQKVGKALVISDNSNFNFNDYLPQPRMMSFAKTASAEGAVADESLNIDIKPIKLTCNVDGVFELL
ncbi:SIMPL domain-containing protein [Sphingobacterium hungaricum]|uniref:SIMPL domain-containing protein n=1 Tax=Sphingobacterium hungaricum TaxID=2082723 RepID=A0A928UW17_9SPHI|nr:SIMPL domain-containing protein [Sphingobacterium hungaricum]MBE8712983.1 SIMPL domain-containing protein [Sphingobacterium hungaricum]